MKKPSNKIVDVGFASKKRQRIVRLKRYGIVEKVESLWHTLGIMVRTGVVVLLAFMLIVGRSYFASANVAYFYPESCLGDWQNPEFAQGGRETDDSADTEAFTTENSAVMHSGAGRVFCGSFTGSLPEGAVPTNVSVGLTFSLKEAIKIEVNDAAISIEGALDSEFIVTSSNATSTESIETIDADSVDSVASSTDEAGEEVVGEVLGEEIIVEEVASKVTEEIIIEEETEVESEPVAEQEPLSWLWGARVAFAQEEVVETEVPETEVTETPEETPIVEVEEEPIVELEVGPEVEAEPPPEADQPSAEEIIEKELSELENGTEAEKIEVVGEKVEKGEEIIETEKVAEGKEAETGEVAGEVMGEATSTEEVVVTGEVAKQAGPLGVAEILYTLDGENWVSVGIVNTGDDGDASFTIPLISLDDIARMQVSVQGLGSAIQTPDIYLDSVWAEVHYELPPEEEKLESNTLRERVTFTSPDFLLLGANDQLANVYQGSDSSVRCEVLPFAQEIQLDRGGRLDFQVRLPSDQVSPLRVRFGDLPLGMSIVDLAEEPRIFSADGVRALNFVVTVDVNTPAGQSGVVVMYDTKSILGSSMQTAECGFSVSVK